MHILVEYNDFLLWQSVLNGVQMLTLLCGTVINAVLIVVMLRSKRLRRQQSYALLLNLCVNDMFMGLANGVLHAIHARDNGWSTGSAGCVVSQIATLGFACLTVWLLLAIALERLLIIVYRSSFDAYRSRFLCFSVVLTVIVFGGPFVGFGDIALHGDGVMCVSKWWDRTTVAQAAYNATTAFIFMAALNVSFYSYYRLYKHIRENALPAPSPVQHNTNAQAANAGAANAPLHPFHAPAVSVNVSQSKHRRMPSSQQLNRTGTAGGAAALGVMAPPAAAAAAAVNLNGTLSITNPAVTVAIAELAPLRVAVDSPQHGARHVVNGTSSQPPVAGRAPAAAAASPLSSCEPSQPQQPGTPLSPFAGSDPGTPASPGQTLATRSQQQHGVPTMSVGGADWKAFRGQERTRENAKKMLYLPLAFTACWGFYAVLQMVELIQGSELPSWYGALCVTCGFCSPLINPLLLLWANPVLHHELKTTWSAFRARVCCCRACQDTSVKPMTYAAGGGNSAHASRGGAGKHGTAGGAQAAPPRTAAAAAAAVGGLFHNSHSSNAEVSTPHSNSHHLTARAAGASPSGGGGAAQGAAVITTGPSQTVNAADGTATGAVGAGQHLAAASNHNNAPHRASPFHVTRTISATTTASSGAAPLSAGIVGRKSQQPPQTSPPLAATAAPVPAAAAPSASASLTVAVAVSSPPMVLVPVSGASDSAATPSS